MIRFKYIPLVAVTLYIVSFISLSPSVLRFVVPVLNGATFLVASIFALGLLFLKQRLNVPLINKYFIFSIYICSFYYLFLALISLNTIYFLRFAQFLATIPILLLLWSIRFKSIQFNQAFYIVVSVLSLLNVLTIFYCTTFKPLPILSFNYSVAGVSYLVPFSFTNSYFQYSGLIRPSSFFDESSTFGQYSFFVFLSASRFYLPATNFFFTIITSACLSLGLFSSYVAYYATILVTSLINFFTKRFYQVFKIRRVILVLLPILVVASIVPFTFFASDSSIVSEYIVTRFNIDTLVDSGRYYNLSRDITAFTNHPFFGLSIAGKVAAGNNPFSILAEYGIIGYIIFYLPFICFISKSLRKYKTKFRIALLFSLIPFMFSRPEIGSASILLLTGGLIHPSDS